MIFRKTNSPYAATYKSRSTTTPKIRVLLNNKAREIKLRPFLSEKGI